MAKEEGEVRHIVGHVQCTEMCVQKYLRLGRDAQLWPEKHKGPPSIDLPNLSQRCFKPVGNTIKIVGKSGSYLGKIIPFKHF